MGNAVSGTLDAVCIAATAGAPMSSRSGVEAIVGRGLLGDRYESGIGTFSGRFEVTAGARHVSIIDAMAIAECNARLVANLGACDLRRNLVIRGLDLDALHGAVIAIGDVRLRLTGGCPPCGYLSRLLGVDARLGLRHIGGARASIIEGGWLTVGALVHVLASQGR
ncbi:MAG: MOSC domain-containing protein [Dokdonella sp.]|uniref:MOSC domain-containing protein n=1 Tax=Dokdonella sp. TaxID=2291710 RepID=UPI003265FA93